MNPLQKTQKPAEAMVKTEETIGNRGKTVWKPAETVVKTEETTGNHNRPEGNQLETSGNRCKQ